MDMGNGYIKQLENFFRNGKQLTHEKGETVYASDYPSPAPMFWLAEGYVKSYLIMSDGSLHVLCIYGPGSLFPLAPLLRGEGSKIVYRYKSTVYFEAMSQATLYMQPTSDLLRLLEREPQMYRTLSKLLILNYDVYLSRLEGSMYKHATERIAHQLLALAARFSSEMYGQSILEVPLTHQDLADSLGMARETVSRGLEQLRSEGVIEMKDKHIIIRDKSALEKVLPSI